MHVAHVNSDHLESSLLFQQGGKMSGPRTEVEQGPFGWQPCTNLLHQPAGSALHDSVKQGLQHHSAVFRSSRWSSARSWHSSNDVGVEGSNPWSSNSRVRRMMAGQKPRSRSL